MDVQPAEPKRVPRERGADRRSRNRVEPPPFMTRDGLVFEERRSPFDRRASWLREYFFDFVTPSC
ncbi:MAG: hypothetical protein ACK4FP_08420 [Azonexus sp.]